MSDLRDFTGKNRKNTGNAGKRISISSTANRVDEKARLRYNESLELMEYYNGTTWISIEAPPAISNVSPTVIPQSDVTTTFTITGNNFSATGLTAQLLSEGGSVITFDTVVRDSDSQITAVLTNTNLGVIDEPYDIQVTNGSGLSNTFADQINVNESPAWTTPAGSLGILFDSARAASFLTSSTLVATDPEGGDVDYHFLGGSLPPGLSFDSETGVISGTADAVTEDTTYNFTIEAHDTASNFTRRSFSIQVKAPVISSFTSTGPGTYSVPNGVTQVKVLVIGGGGSAGAIGGGGGAGGLVYHETFPVTPGGSIAYSVGTGGTSGGNYPTGTTPTRGNPSTFGTLTALGGESSGNWSANPVGGTVGSGAGGPGNPSAGNIGGTADQPGQSNPGATHNAGFPGAQGGTNPGSNSTTGAGTYTGGGGGGAGFAGGWPTQTAPGDTRNNTIAGRKGGDGLQIDITGTATYYAGGGGGARHVNGYQSPQAKAVGGLGGGGSTTPGPTGQSGTANTGGGGAGANYTSSGNGAGGAGGSGVIIVRS